MNPYAIPGVEIVGAMMTTDEKVGYIKKKVCEYLNIDLNTVMIDGRPGASVYARYIIIYFIDKYTGLSQKDIAGLIKKGGYERSMISYAVNKVKGQLTSKLPSEYKTDIPAIEKIIGL